MHFRLLYIGLDVKKTFLLILLFFKNALFNVIYFLNLGYFSVANIFLFH